MKIATIPAFVSVLAGASAWSTTHHDEVATIPEAVAPGHNYFLAVRPEIDVTSYCAPFPAVDAHGIIGQGLAANGPLNGQCSSSSGQIYARSGTLANGQVGVMYGWYFPKEQDDGGQYRHAWHFVVVWLNLELSKTPSIKAVSYLEGTMWSKKEQWNKYLDRVWFFKNGNALNLIDDRLKPADAMSHIHAAKVQPLIDWDVMPAPAKEALNSYSWGGASLQQVYMNEFHFKTQMQYAWDSTTF